MRMPKHGSGSSSGGAPLLGSRRYKDRKTSFKQLAASDERLDVSSSDAPLDDIVRARASLVGADRLTELLSSSSTSQPAIQESVEEGEEGSGLGQEANRRLERIQTNLGLRNRGVWDGEDVGEGGMQFYSNTPRQSDQDGAADGMSPAGSAADSGFGITINLDDMKVVALNGEQRDYHRMDSATSSGSEGLNTPGLEVFGDLGYREDSTTDSSTFQQLPAHAGQESAYSMAVRSVMLAWEKPAESLVDRMQLADTLRTAFAKDKAEHLQVLRDVMQENCRAADELAARIDDLEESVVEDFMEVEAAEAWEKGELVELRRMLKQQLGLPVFNAMLEVAVIKGKDLKSKASTRRFACLTPYVVTDHLVVIDMLQQPLGGVHLRSSAPPAPIRTDLARGDSPTWNIKASPIFLQQPLSTMRMQVCTSGFFDDQQSREAKTVVSALPLMSAIPMDAFPTLGQHTVGWCRIALSRDSGDPETGYLLPVERTVPILRKSRGAFGGCLSPQNDFPPLRVEEEERDSDKKGRKGWTEMGQVQIVLRYVPETREASPSSSEIRNASKGAYHQPNKRHSSVPTPSVASDVDRRAAGQGGGGESDEAPTPMSTEDAAKCYRLLMMRLWDCWGKDISLRFQDGHTFSLLGQNNGGSSCKTLNTRLTLSKAAAKGSWSQKHNGGQATLQLEGSSDGKGQVVPDALAKYCPGEPWTTILEAAAKLYRVRRTWHELLMVKRLLLSWTLEPDYLEALMLLWKPIVAAARDGQCTRREGLLHVGCTQLIVRHCIRAIEFYHVAFGERRSIRDTVVGLRRLLQLTCLAIRYDTHVDALVEPLKIHISRAVGRRVRQALPRGPMKRDVYLAALRDAIELATSALRRDLELADAFPASLDLPHFTARLRYKKLSDHMRHFFTGPGVVAYDRLVMDVQDKLYELHQLMIDAGLSVAVLAGEPAGSSHIRLLNMDKMFGRSLLKWIRDIGLNMKEWVDNAVKVDRTAEWVPIGGRVYYSTSVVDLLRIFQDVTEKMRERMPPMSEQTTLHSDVYERLQASIHYVLRHYAENLEELCISGLNEARRDRHEELREESKQADPRRVLRLLEPLASSSGKIDPEAEEPCVNRQLCVLLSNLHALQDNMQLVNKRMLEAVCGENSRQVREKLGGGTRGGGVEEFDDSLSELSFMSDDLDSELPGGQLAGKLDRLEEDLVERADFQDGRSSTASPERDECGGERARLAPSTSRNKEDLPSQRMRTWQKYCNANQRVVGTSISNCVNCMADTLQTKLLLEVIRLLHAEEMRAQVLDTVVEGGASAKKRASAFDLTLGSFRSSPSKKRAMSPDHVAVFLKEVNLDLFVQRLLDIEINLLASHMVPSVFRTVMTSTWCSLVSAMETLVLAVSGWWRPLTGREGRIISQLLDAGIAWFHSDGEGLPMEDLRSVASRLMELLELHAKPVSAIELKYNDLWVQHGGKEELRRQRDAPPSGWMHKGADMVGDAPELMSSFESRFRKDVSNGVAMIHLIRLLRQRNHEPAAMDLLNKMLKDAAEYPMQVIFGKWGEPMLGQWPCMLARQNEAGSLCVSLNYIGFTTIQPGVAGLLVDTSMLLPLAQVTRMERTYEHHLQCLSFTMHDKTYHPFSGGQKTFPAREDIYQRVAEAAGGTGSTLDRSLRGEVATEGPKTLNLPAGEEIFHSLECTRIIGGGLWYNRGVLYSCKSFVMFDRPGKERVTVPYGDILSLKMDEVQSWASHPDSRLVLDTRSMGRLVFGKCALDAVVACMSSIASQVATVNEYNDK